MVMIFIAYNSNSELRVVTAAKNLCSYVLNVTNKSPKSLRFTLVSRLQNLVLDAVENVYKANEIFVQNKDFKNMQKCLELQHTTLINVKIFAYMALFAREQRYILTKQYEQISKLAHGYQYLLGVWIKSNKKYF